MEMSRTKNATRNVFWGVLEKIATLLLPFAVRTVMIKTLGAEYLGLTNLFTSILSVLSVTELGFSNAIVFSMYKPIAEDDTDTLCALLNFYRKIYYVIGSIILICGFALVPFLPRLIKGNVPADVNIYILYFIYLFNTVIGYFMFSYKTAIFSAYQRNDLLSKRIMFTHTIGNILQIILLLVFRNYYFYVMASPLIGIFLSFTMVVMAKKYYPQLVCRGKISKESKIALKKHVKGLFSYKIYGVIFSSVDSMVISSFLGLVPLAIFNNYYYINTAITGFLVIFTTSITAGIGNKMVVASREENYKDFKKIIFVNGWITSWCTVCLICLYQPFIAWWVGEEFLFPFLTMILMVLIFFFPRITTITYTYREAAGLWWEDRFRPLIAAVVNLAVNIILVRYIGINGVIISTLVCTLLINVPWGTAILFRKYFQRSPKEYYGLLLYYFLITVLVGGVSYLICAQLPGTGFVYLLLKGVICLVVPNVLFWFIYRKRDEFSFFRDLANRLIKTRIKGA